MLSRAENPADSLIVRFFSARGNLAFTRPQAVEKLDFEFWILKLNIRLASSQCSKLMFVGERANGACLGVGEAEDGSHTLKPALARVTEY